MADKEYTVILRVKEIPKEDASSVNDDWMCCSPVDTEYPPRREYMWLKKSRLLEGTWRYGVPKKGERYLYHSHNGLMLTTAMFDFKDCGTLILDPPAPTPEAVPEWEIKMREVLAKDGWPGGSIKDFMDALIEARHQWRKEKEGEE